MKGKYEKEELRREKSKSENRILKGEQILVVSTGNFDVFYGFYEVEFMANRNYVHNGSPLDIMSLGINKPNIWYTVVKYSAYLVVRVNADECPVPCLIGLLRSHVLEMPHLYFSPVVDYHDMRFVVRVSHSNKIPDYKFDSINAMEVYVKVEVYLHSFLISALR